MDWEKLRQILNCLTNTKILTVTTIIGEEIKIERGAMSVDFCLKWIKIDSGGASPRTFSWNQISMLTFEFENGKSLSLALSGKK